VHYVAAEPFFPHGDFGKIRIAAESFAGEREPRDWRHDPRLDVAACEKMPEPHLDEEPVARLGRIRIKRGERQRFNRATFIGMISLFAPCQLPNPP